MTVAELIEALKAFPATAEVYVENTEGSGNEMVSGVMKRSEYSDDVSITFSGYDLTYANDDYSL